MPTRFATFPTGSSTSPQGPFTAGPPSLSSSFALWALAFGTGPQQYHAIAPDTGPSKTIFPSQSFPSFSGSPGSQNKAPAPEPLSPAPTSGYPLTPPASVASGGQNTATPHPPNTLPVPEDWLQDHDYLDTRRSIGNLSCPRFVESRPLGLEKKDSLVVPSPAYIQPTSFTKDGTAIGFDGSQRAEKPTSLLLAPKPKWYWQESYSHKSGLRVWTSSPGSAAKPNTAPALAGQNLRQLPLQFSPGSNLGTPVKPEPSSIMQPPQEGSAWLASHFPAKCHDKELKAWMNSLTLMIAKNPNCKIG